MDTFKDVPHFKPIRTDELQTEVIVYEPPFGAKTCSGIKDSFLRDAVLPDTGPQNNRTPEHSGTPPKTWTPLKILRKAYNLLKYVTIKKCKYFTRV